MPAESCKVLKGRCVGMDMYQLNWNESESVHNAM